MARITIDKKIVKYNVAKDDEPAKPAPERAPESNVIRMHEKLERPEVLIGAAFAGSFIVARIFKRIFD